MNGATAGLVSGIAGTIIGFLGGVIGCYRSIRNTKGPLERAFMIRASLVGFAGVTLFLVGLLVTPLPYRMLWWLVYPFALNGSIRTVNRNQQRLREEDASHVI